MDKYYLFRSTTAHITEHLEHIEESGDAVVSCAFIGEKHWIIVCRRGELRPAPVLPSAELRKEWHRQAAGAL